jgi:hypothetical protein
MTQTSKSKPAVPATSMAVDRAQNEDRSIKAILIATPVVAMIVLLLNQLFNAGQALSILGRPSFAIYITPIAMLVVFAVFMWRYLTEFYPKGNSADMYKRRLAVVADGISLGLVYMIVAGAITIWLERIFSNSFVGLKLDQYTSSLLIGVVIGIVTYSIIRLTRNISSKQIINVLALFLIGGVIVSMLTTKEPAWWEANFSTLGQATQEFTASYYIFNLTLILSGFALVVLARQVISDAKEVFTGGESGSKNKLRTVYVFMVVASLGLAGVGLFPYTPDTYKAFMHVLSAGLVAISFGVLIGLLRWLLPDASKSFLAISYIILASLVGSYILYARIGYLGLTAFELGCFAICFSWLYLFTQQVVNSKEYNKSERG